MVRAKLHLLSPGIVSMRFLGQRDMAEEAERAVALLAPSCEPHHRTGCWIFPLPYLPDVARVLKSHVAQVAASPELVAAHRRWKKFNAAILALKSKSTESFPAAPYETIFRQPYLPRQWAYTCPECGVAGEDSAGYG